MQDCNKIYWALQTVKFYCVRQAMNNLIYITRSLQGGKFFKPEKRRGEIFYLLNFFCLAH